MEITYGDPAQALYGALRYPAVVAMTAAERLRLIREALEASLPLRLRIALPRDLDELAEDVLEAEGDDALSASAGQLAEWGRRYAAMIRVRIAVDAAGAAIGDVLTVLRSAGERDREIQGRIRWMRSVIADRVAELLNDLAGDRGEGVDGVQTAEA